MDTTNVIEVKHSDMPDRMKAVIMAELRSDFAEWMEANQDEVCRPHIELTKEGKAFTAWVVMRGFSANDIEIMAAPDMLLIKGETADHKRLMSSVKFPQPIDPAKVHVAMRDGLLSIRAEIARGSNIVVFLPKVA